MAEENQPAGHPTTATEEDAIFVASQWQLIRWRFKKHKAAVISSIIILLLALLGIFCEFLSPADPLEYSTVYMFAPPQSIHIFRDGQLVTPYVLGWQSYRDPDTLLLTYEVDPEQIYDIKFFVQGSTYKMWGLWESNTHFMGVEDADAPFHLLGADRKGRDVLSRCLYGTRISMSVGLVGVFMSLILGILIGGISGYYGGVADMIIQRLIEFLRSMPPIPLWMALSAALPADWPVIKVYFGITILLSLISWTDLARVVRGRFLALKSEDFVMAAKLSGAGDMRIIVRHMVPSFTSHIIASLTLSIPNMILSETSLSFLGLGLRAPAVSWGVLLQEAQNTQTVVLAPWLFYPAVFVIVAVLAFNFMGDGLRDAADPYSR